VLSALTMPYKASISGLDLANAGNGASELAARMVQALLKSVAWSSAAIVTMKQDYSRDAYVFEIVFDASAWTGRK